MPANFLVLIAGLAEWSGAERSGEVGETAGGAGRSEAVRCGGGDRRWSGAVLVNPKTGLVKGMVLNFGGPFDFKEWF